MKFKNQWCEPQSKLWKQNSATSHGELYHAFSSAEVECESGFNCNFVDLQ